MAEHSNPVAVERLMAAEVVVARRALRLPVGEAERSDGMLTGREVDEQTLLARQLSEERDHGRRS